MKTILVIEDDPAIQLGIKAALDEEHYEVLIAGDGEKGFLMAKRENIDLIILDLTLPKRNGESICRDLRKDGIQTPIIILTSKKEELDEVLLLELGADDYQVKPITVRKLQARAKALLRRETETRKDLDEYTFGTVHVDFRKREAIRGKEPVRMSSKEFEVLKYFILHEGQVVTRHMLLDEVWGYEHEPTTRTVDNYILSLRKKIEDDPSHPRHILTIHTTGYKFVSNA